MMSLAWASSYVVISTVELTLSPLSISASLTTVGAIVMVFIVGIYLWLLDALSFWAIYDLALGLG